MWDNGHVVGSRIISIITTGILESRFRHPLRCLRRPSWLGPGSASPAVPTPPRPAPAREVARPAAGRAGLLDPCDPWNPWFRTPNTRPARRVQRGRPGPGSIPSTCGRTGRSMIRGGRDSTEAAGRVRMNDGPADHRGSASPGAMGSQAPQDLTRGANRCRPASERRHEHHPCHL